MFSRSLRRFQPLARAALLSRRHFMMPPEFRVFNRLVEDFFREPLFTGPRLLTQVEPYGVLSGMRLFREDNKLVAQMRLPQNVKPEDVKIALKDGRLCVSIRSEVNQENFRSVKEFHEELKLNDSTVLMDKMEAYVDSIEGRLRIEAPLKEPEQSGQVRLNIDMGSKAIDDKK
ncbi:uncharacterized protein LOC111265341 [Varroa jacobsoni]|uniref:SHSP domain-containing protein n=1 Tax=Varroa destructor TaxID=109461 RepID=A0A7M7JE91_VARDE|nr:uncharacterized protein LOC111245898 [Varroa destructor]XP_022697675.1 uncharacterized protein LOC111265341 [Varroa jacobsoni]